MAGARFREVRDDWAHLFHHVEPAPPFGTTVPPSRLTVRLLHPLHGRGGALVDRTRETYVIGKGIGSGFEVDLGGECRVDGIALSPVVSDGRLLPASFVIEASTDGTSYREVLRVRDAEPMCYRAGNAVYVRGGYGWQECRFAPVRARCLRFTVTGEAEASPMWRANELFVFAHADETIPGEAGEDAEVVIRLIKEQGVAFTACDRWLSARLVEALPTKEEGGRPAYPRLNDHYHFVGAAPPEPRRTFAPSPHVAVAVAAALADEQEEILRRACGSAGLGVQREDLGHYSLFLFQGPAGATGAPLEWNGLLLLR